MTILEQELLETVKHLDTVRQEQVLAYARSLTQANESKLEWEEWLARAQESVRELREYYGADYAVGSKSLLDEAREERLNDLMGGR